MKQFAKFFLCLTAALMLTACGSGKKSDTNPIDEVDTGDDTVSVTDGPETAGNILAAMEKLMSNMDTETLGITEQDMANLEIGPALAVYDYDEAKSSFTAADKEYAYPILLGNKVVSVLFTTQVERNADQPSIKTDAASEMNLSEYQYMQDITGSFAVVRLEGNVYLKSADKALLMTIPDGKLKAEAGSDKSAAVAAADGKSLSYTDLASERVKASEIDALVNGSSNEGPSGEAPDGADISTDDNTDTPPSGDGPWMDADDTSTNGPTSPADDPSLVDSVDTGQDGPVAN